MSTIYCFNYIKGLLNLEYYENNEKDKKKKIIELTLCLRMIEDNNLDLSITSVIQNAKKISDIFNNICFENKYICNLRFIWIDFIVRHTNHCSELLKIKHKYADSNNDCKPKSFYEIRFHLLRELYESIFRIHEPYAIKDKFTTRTWNLAYKLNEELKNLCVKE